MKEVLQMWSDDTNEERLYHRVIQESFKILGAERRDRRGWTREEMMEASGMSREAFSQTYLEFLEGSSSYPFSLGFFPSFDTPSIPQILIVLS